ncbi:hypothetical protein Ddye_013003 [Dipteronia dyeriana]|uniref:HTH three-helical bundle domain-containing protein n=1 Tax=Dipteronia dyeriana TaxID=168575 RepID=A0AAD9X5K2_9ROSI|nr:hypothetical protein Ddye_013003 [Dipteronia dyeriana]
MESPFPSPHEFTVASALLLLSTTNPLSLSPPLFDTDGELLLQSKSGSSEEESLSLSLDSSGGSKRCASSSLTTDDGSSNQIQARKLRIIAVVARCHEMNLQVVRKRRSTMWQKPETVKPPPPPPAKVVCSESASIDGGSCLSSGTSVDSSARSQSGRDEPMRKNVRGVHGGYNHIERRADAILKLLSSGGCSSEVKIRQVLGDSPDTSKALRMLLKHEEVKRSGTGGRQDPYIYMIA